MAELAAKFVGMVLCGAAVLAPMFLGASGEWARLGLEMAAALSAIAWAAAGNADRLSLLIPPVAVGILTIQLMPIPAGLLDTVSPISAAAWEAAGNASGDLAATISVDPSATATGLRRLLLGLSTVAVACSIARSPVWRKNICSAMAAAGLLIWAVGIAFPTTPEDRILLGFIDMKGPIDYWLTPIEPPVRTCGVGERATVVAGDRSYTILEGRSGDVFSPYIYSNHYAGALCLTVPPMLACVVAGLRGRTPPWAAWLAAAGISLAAIATTAGLVKSRAGCAALVFGILVFFSLCLSPSRWRSVLRWATAALGVMISLFMAVFFGILSGVQQIVPDSMQPVVTKLLADPRIGETAAAIRMFRGSPAFGTGLNTYGSLNATIDHDRFVSYYAHNDYAQWLSETGVLGALLGVAAAFLLLRRGRQSLAIPNGEADPFTAAAWAAVAAIAVHSAFDWNLHLPANAFLAALAAGLCLSLATKNPWAASAQHQSRSPAGFLPRIAFCAACIPAALFLARDAMSEHAQRRLRTAITADRMHQKKPDSPAAAAALLDAVTAGESAARRDPANAGLAMLLGQASLHLAAIQQQAIAKDAFDQSAASWLRRAQAASAVSTGFPKP